MTPKIFTILGGAAAVTVVAAVATHSISSRWQPADSERSLIFPGLAAHASEIDRLTITQGGRELVIARDGGRWLLENRDNYPADTTRVRSNIVGLTELHRIEPKTRNPELYARLEVEDPDGEGAKSRHVAVTGKDDETLATLIVGKQNPRVLGAGRNGVYVRLDDDEQSWLAGGDITISADVGDWVDTGLVALPVAEIASVHVKRGGAYPIDLVRPAGEDKGFTVTELPEGLKPVSNYALQSQVLKMTRVNFDDVRAESATGEPDILTRIDGTSGLSLTISHYGGGGGQWVRVAAAGEGAAAEQARAINGRFGGWEVHIPESAVDDLVLMLSDVVDAENS